MNMREMDGIELMNLWITLETAIRYAHGIDALIDAKQYADESKEMLVRMIASRETILRSKLAQIADMLGLALVEKAVLEPDTALLAERERGE